MKEPIIIYENGSMDIFESVKKAELKIEPIDVKNGEFIYYDSEARILQAFVVKDSRGIERTVITDSEEEKINNSELEKILIDFLEYLDYQRQELEKMELSSLVRESLKFKTD